jgi:hypothetical protein
MPSPFFALADLIEPLLDTDRLTEAEDIVKDRLGAIVSNPFEIAINASFTNSPRGIAELISASASNQKDFVPKAAYAELCGLPLHLRAARGRTLARFPALSCTLPHFRGEA